MVRLRSNHSIEFNRKAFGKSRMEEEVKRFKEYVHKCRLNRNACNTNKFPGRQDFTKISSKVSKVANGYDLSPIGKPSYI